MARDATLASAAARLRVRCTFLRMHVHVFVPYVRRSRARRERRARVIQTCLGEPMLLLLLGYRHDETCRFKSSEIAVCGPGNWSASKKWSGAPFVCLATEKARRLGATGKKDGRVSPRGDLPDQPTQAYMLTWFPLDPPVSNGLVK